MHCKDNAEVALIVSWSDQTGHECQRDSKGSERVVASFAARIDLVKEQTARD